MNFDLNKKKLTLVNTYLQNVDNTYKHKKYKIINPNGLHAICAGLNQNIEINIIGHTGYYCAGMNKKANITIEGNVGTGLAENMMSGRVHVKGNASQSAGASAHGGIIIIDGDTSSRCGISMKGVDIVVKGSVGHMSAFMAQSGNLLICGNAGEALGDSIYETNIYIAGKVKSLGADCIEKKITKKDINIINNLIKKSDINKYSYKNFKKYASARKLYNFNIDNVSKY